MQKYIKEVFGDYNTNNSIADAEIENINLYKKTNKIQITVVSDKQVYLQDIEEFENYIVKRFKVDKAFLNINYKNVDINQDISSNWENIIKYVAKKEPFSKAILTNSSVELKEDDKINVNLFMKGTSFLLSKKFDKGLEHLLLNLYNKKYTVEFIENNISPEMEKELIEKRNREEKEVLLELEKQAKIEAEAIKEKKKLERETQKLKKIEEEKKIKEELKNENPELAAKIEAYENDSKNTESPLILGRSLTIRTELVKVESIPMNEETEMRVCIDGEILKDSLDLRNIKNEKAIVMFDLFDGTSTIACKAFLDKDKAKKVKDKIAKAKGLRVEGNAKYSTYSKEVEIMINTIIESTGIKKEIRTDNAKEKRVELHMHTQMSQLDAITPCSDLLKRAVKWGWKSIAITDHGVVQSFPDAHKFIQKTGSDLKVIYGVEAYFCPDKDPCVADSKGQSIDTEYCVFDLETTGISHITEKITEIGAIKIKNGEIVDSFSTFVNPEKPIPEEVVNVTHITDDMVKDSPTIDKVMPEFLEFIGDSVLVAHNADFDVGYMKYNCEKLGISFEHTHIDTLRLAKAIFPEFGRYNLGYIADKLGIKVEVAHRALDDVKTLVAVFNEMTLRAKDRKAKIIDDFDNVFDTDFRKLPTYHMIILAQNYVGLKNLYKLVSYSHLNYFYKKPRILKSILNQYREGLIIGSACEAGELYKAIVNRKIGRRFRRNSKIL